jgi:4-alpha-glucanotransferase
VLSPCTAALDGARAHAFTAFLRARPDVEAYARYRAARERWGPCWWEWPDGAAGLMLEQDESARFHAYAQWLCEEALAELATRAERDAAGLFLDLPLGVREDGFDVFRAPESYLRGASTGAPPDDFFAGGQDWGFPPPHPARASGELALAVRRHARFARVLRLDHVMALHRLWVVPRDGGARDGAYVRYPREELLANVALEADRAGCAIVGEDLGTVPDAVREAMGTHRLHRTVVLGFSFDPGDPESAERIPARAVVGLGTHDTPPFASFWRGVDLDEHEAFGELAGAELEAARARRARFRSGWTGLLARRGLVETAQPSDAEVLAASLRFLGASPAAHVQVALEDLWAETRRPNVPGTARPTNWRGRARLSLTALEGDELANGLLRALVAARGELSPRP